MEQKLKRQYYLLPGILIGSFLYAVLYSLYKERMNTTQYIHDVPLTKLKTSDIFIFCNSMSLSA